MHTKGLLSLAIIVFLTSCGTTPSAVKFTIWTKPDTLYEYQPLVVIAEAVNTSKDTLLLDGLMQDIGSWHLTGKNHSYKYEVFTMSSFIPLPPGDTLVTSCDLTPCCDNRYLPPDTYTVETSACYLHTYDDQMHGCHEFRDSLTLVVLPLESNLKRRFMDSLQSISRLGLRLPRFAPLEQWVDDFRGTPVFSRAVRDLVHIPIPREHCAERNAIKDRAVEEYVATYGATTLGIILANSFYVDRKFALHLMEKSPRAIGDYYQHQRHQREVRSEYYRTHH